MMPPRYISTISHILSKNKNRSAFFLKKREYGDGLQDRKYSIYILNEVLMMKSFYHCFVILIMIFSFVFPLIGCSGIGLLDTDVNLTDEEKVENVINDFFLALNEQDWEEAKSLCVIDSIWYDFVFDFERFVNENINDIYILEYSLSISSFYFTGCTCHPLAIVFGEFFISLTKNGELQGIEEWGIITLDKSDNNWQLFSDELPTGLII